MKDKENKDDRGTLDLSLIIDQHKREIWKWKMKESEWVKTANQLEGTKRIVEELATKNVDLKKEIDRLAEENNNLQTIDSSHQKLNGELQSKITEVENEMALLKGIGNNSPEMRELKRDNKYLAKQVEDYREILKKAGL
jgi:division protein CdvB (Snf7/Vps24/ESCRT-III family)|tara:strand:+ start:237 stop:653 length:417 start_codon:yes stop_codon:yes gene_type:complete